MKQQPLGVGVIVLNKDKSHILLGKRLNAYKAGMLGLPGGRLDLKESLKKCGKRELVEETSLVSNDLKYLGVIRELQEEFNFIHFAFVCTDFTGTPKVVEPNKCEDLEWYPLDNLPDNILPGHRAILDLYLHPENLYIDIIKI